MASSNTLQVASVTSTLTFAKTDAEVAQILTWFIAGWASPEPEGLTQAQLNKWKLDQANARIKDMVVHIAAQNRVKELKAAQANLETQAQDETAL